MDLLHGFSSVQFSSQKFERVRASDMLSTLVEPVYALFGYDAQPAAARQALAPVKAGNANNAGPRKAKKAKKSAAAAAAAALAWWCWR